MSLEVKKTGCINTVKSIPAHNRSRNTFGGLRSGLFASALCMLAFTCEEQYESPVVARVGKATLTLDDVYKSIPPEFSDHITREQMINYVKQWIDTELLFQEALHQKIHKEKEIRERIEKMKKDLLSAEVISRTSFAASKNLVSEEAILTYYEAHKDSFIRESDVVKYIGIVVDSLSTAWKVRNQMTADNFLDLAVRYSRTPVQDPRSVPYVALSSLPPELSSVLDKIRVNGATAPIKLGEDFHVIRVLDKQPAGSICKLEEVRGDIISTLSSQSQKKDMERLLSDLRLKMDYEFHFELIPGNGNVAKESPAKTKSSTTPDSSGA